MGIDGMRAAQPANVGVAAAAGAQEGGAAREILEHGVVDLHARSPRRRLAGRCLQVKIAGDLDPEAYGPARQVGQRQFLDLHHPQRIRGGTGGDRRLFGIGSGRGDGSIATQALV